VIKVCNLSSPAHRSAEPFFVSPPFLKFPLLSFPLSLSLLFLLSFLPIYPLFPLLLPSTTDPHTNWILLYLFSYRTPNPAHLPRIHPHQNDPHDPYTHLLRAGSSSCTAHHQRCRDLAVSYTHLREVWGCRDRLIEPARERVRC
jgi:hypothetical protein